MQLRNDFAKHISELNNPIERPYSQPIDKTLLSDHENDIDYLNREIHNINPDYLTFFPAYFWCFYFVIGWIYVSALFLSNFIYDDITYVYVRPEGWGLINIVGTILYLLAAGIPLLLLLYQFITKKPFRTQYYFLKQQQKIAYYYRPLWKIRQPYELKIVDYKDVHPDLHQDKGNRAYTPLNLYVADPETGDITHHLKLEDYNVNPRVQWAFIRTYMESPSEELPIDSKLCQAYPTDTSGSLFACSDIIYRREGSINTKHTGETAIAMLAIGSVYALGNLFHGINYQCVKRAILHPDVQKILTWDGQDNPYPIQPITPEAQKAFEGKNWQVNLRWIIAIAINVSLFAWVVAAYNS